MLSSSNNGMNSTQSLLSEYTLNTSLFQRTDCFRATKQGKKGGSIRELEAINEPELNTTPPFN